uniref:Uncharacterized protein n=1 Tax=Anguilla anguilla TaxID=7936 RepID=A0A0E9RT61_ANGAN
MRCFSTAYPGQLFKNLFNKVAKITIWKLILKY